MKILSILLLIITFLLENCGFHIKHGIKTNTHSLLIKFIHYDDKRMNLITKIKDILNLNNIKIINNNSIDNILILTINDIIEDNKIISVFNDGNSKENQLILILNIKIILPNKKNYSITISTKRNILINSTNSLHKNHEYEFLKKEMIEEIAYKLIDKILILY